MSRENEITIETDIKDQAPLGRRTAKHDFYANIVFRAYNKLSDSNGISNFVSIVAQNGQHNDPYVAVDRFRFLISGTEGDPFRPNSYRQIAQSMDMSVSRVRRAEVRVVRIAADICEDLNIPTIPPLPRPTKRAR